jgi:hypothetical protein
MLRLGGVGAAVVLAMAIYQPTVSFLGEVAAQAEENRRRQRATFPRPASPPGTLPWQAFSHQPSWEHQPTAPPLPPDHDLVTKFIHR